MIMSEGFNPETLKTGDRVKHADMGNAVGVIERFQAYPLVTVQWESTGRESTENMYYLTPAD